MLQWNRLLLLACIAVIAALTLMPQATGMDQAQAALGPFGVRGLADSLANILLFLPLGVAAAVTLRGRSPLWLGAGFSTVIELVQWLVPGRFPSAWDVAFNTAGTALGFALVRYRHQLCHPQERLRRLLATLAFVLALGILVGGALLLRPGPVRLPLRAEWTPVTPAGDVYGGRVTAARLGSEPLPAGPLPLTRAPMARIRHGDSLLLAFHAGPRPATWVPLFRIAHGSVDPALTVGVRLDDVVFSYRTRAAALHLDQPHLRFRGALRDVALGQELLLTVSADSVGTCVEVAGRRACAAPSLGQTWALLLHPLPTGTETIVSFFWVLVLLVPAGFWLRGTASLLTAAAAFALAVVAAARWWQLPGPLLPVLAAGAIGLGAGYLAALWRGGRRELVAG